MGEETGAEVYLDKAPLKYKGLKPWEIWVSEAQERMVLSVKPKNLKKIMKIFEEENVEAVVIGKFTSDKKLKLFYKGNKVADLDMDFLHNGNPRFTRNAVWVKNKENKNILPKEKKDLTPILKKVLSTWNICSKEWIVRQYDHEVQGGSVLKPFVGVNNDGPSDGSVNRPFLDSYKGVVLSNGINPNYGDIDPYWMAASVIDEALRGIVAVGGNIEKTALLDNFCWGNTDKPKQLGGLVRASLACYDMAKVYGTPFISGKDSLNNEFNTGKTTISIPPTLLISAISVVDDVRKTISSDAKESGSLLYVVGKTFQELGGSQYLFVNGKSGGAVPKVDAKESLKAMKKLSKAIEMGLVLSCHDVSDGGIATSIAEMLFSGGKGAEIDLKKVPKNKLINRDDVVLFSESNSRFIVEIKDKNKKEFEKIMKGVSFGTIGKTDDTSNMIVKGLKGNVCIKANVEDLKKSWKKPFRKLMHEKN